MNSIQKHAHLSTETLSVMLNTANKHYRILEQHRKSGFTETQQLTQLRLQLKCEKKAFRAALAARQLPLFPEGVYEKS